MLKKLITKNANAAIAGSVRDLGYSSVKEEQKLVILNGNDVFVPYQLAMVKAYVTFAFLAHSIRLNSVEKPSIVVIASPLVAIIKDQVTLYSSKGVSAAYSSRETDYEMARGVTEVRFSNVAFKIEATSKTSHF